MKITLNLLLALAATCAHADEAKCSDEFLVNTQNQTANAFKNNNTPPDCDKGLDKRKKDRLDNFNAYSPDGFKKSVYQYYTLQEIKDKKITLTVNRCSHRYDQNKENDMGLATGALSEKNKNWVECNTADYPPDLLKIP